MYFSPPSRDLYVLRSWVTDEVSLSESPHKAASHSSRHNMILRESYTTGLVSQLGWGRVAVECGESYLAQAPVSCYRLSPRLLWGGGVEYTSPRGATNLLPPTTPPSHFSFSRHIFYSYSSRNAAAFFFLNLARFRIPFIILKELYNG